MKDDTITDTDEERELKQGCYVTLIEKEGNWTSVPVIFGALTLLIMDLIRVDGELEPAKNLLFLCLMHNNVICMSGTLLDSLSAPFSAI